MSKISASGGILVFEIDAFMRIIMSMGQPVIKNVVTFSSISIARRPDRQPCNCCYPSVTRRKSVICERRLSVCLLEWAKGFRTLDPTLAVMPFRILGSPGGAQPTSWAPVLIQGHLFPKISPKIRETTNGSRKFTVAQRTGRGAVPIKLDRGRPCPAVRNTAFGAHSVRRFLFASVRDRKRHTLSKANSTIMHELTT